MRVLHRPEQLKELAGERSLYAEIAPPGAPEFSASLLQAGLTEMNPAATFVRIEAAPEQLDETVARMRGLPFEGWTALAPHDLAMEAWVDEQRESARLLRAVNTVVRDGGRRIGFHTGGDGWVRAVRDELYIDVRDLKILLVGTTGVGRSLARQAASEGCDRLVLTDPSGNAGAEDLVAELRERFISDKLLGARERLLAVPFETDALRNEIDATELLVNATGLGRKATDPPVFPDRLMQPHLCVQELLPHETRFLDSARKAGARPADGRSTLLHQAALSLELWTARAAPLGSLRNVLREDKRSGSGRA